MVKVPLYRHNYPLYFYNKSLKIDLIKIAMHLYGFRSLLSRHWINDGVNDWNFYVLSNACLTWFENLELISSWQMLIQQDHYSYSILWSMTRTLICDVTNDLGIFYNLFQYKWSDFTGCTWTMVIAFNRFQIMARDIWPRSRRWQPVRWSRLTWSYDIIWRLRFEPSSILSFYAFYISRPVNTSRRTIFKINHC